MIQVALEVLRETLRRLHAREEYIHNSCSHGGFVNYNPYMVFSRNVVNKNIWKVIGDIKNTNGTCFYLKNDQFDGFFGQLNCILYHDYLGDKTYRKAIALAQSFIDVFENELEKCLQEEKVCPGLDSPEEKAMEIPDFSGLIGTMIIIIIIGIFLPR